MATIVEGEASESDEEEVVSVSVTVAEHLHSISPSPITNQKASFEHYRLPTSTDGNRSLADEPQAYRTTSSHTTVNTVLNVEAQHPNISPAPKEREPHTFSVPSKYRGVLQKKLVEEILTVRNNVETLTHKGYTDSIRQLVNMAKQTDTITGEIKHSAHQLQLLTNDLFRLEDIIDEVNLSETLPQMRLPTPSVSDASANIVESCAAVSDF